MYKENNFKRYRRTESTKSDSTSKDVRKPRKVWREFENNLQSWKRIAEPDQRTKSTTWKD